MEKLTITRQFRFEAAHQLLDIECYGKCRALHGHSYILYVEVSYNKDKELLNEELGWIVNFSDIKEIVNTSIIDVCDHQFLNAVLPIKITTAENIILWMKDVLQKNLPKEVELESLTLYETAKCKTTWKK